MKQMLTTGEVMDRLRKRYADTGYAVLREVGDATGARQKRWADALCMSLWPSRGLSLIGFEVKVSRGDWLKELKDPSKADAICRYCDRWYVVAGDASIVRPGELPPTWGLLVPHGEGLKVSVEAPELSPQPFDRLFVASIMRRACEQSVDDTVINAAYERGRAEEYKRSQERESRTFDSFQKKIAELEKSRSEFERDVGVSLDWRWKTGCDAKLFRQIKPLIQNKQGLADLLGRLRKEAVSVIEMLDGIGPVEILSEGSDADE